MLVRGEYNTSMFTKKYGIIAVITLVLGAGVFFYGTQGSGHSTGENGDMSTSAPLEPAGEIHVASSTAPSLTKPVAYMADLSPEAKNILQDKIAAARSVLSKNYEDYTTWLEIAIRYKQAGDLPQAKAVWEYLANIHPDDAVSRHNLGDVYALYLKEYPKAEMYYKQAIAITPKEAINYLSLSDMYRYSYKQNTSAAEDILKLGISQVPAPQVEDLKKALAAFQQAQ